MIQYSPIIADTIPGFVVNNEGLATVTIPFQQNMAIAEDQIIGYELKYREYNSTQEPKTKRVNSEQQLSNKVEFSLPNMIPEQYYKMQLSYILSNEEHSAFSSVAIGRCVGRTSDFTVQITGLQKDIINLNLEKYEGQYQTSILTEPVYSYQFELMLGSQVVEDSGVILHNATKDTIEEGKRSCTHYFTIQQELDKDKVYKLIYTITTINGYVITNEYQVLGETLVLPTNYSGKVMVNQDCIAYENGYVNILLESQQPLVDGIYALERQEDGGKWYELTKFEMGSLSNICTFTWQDKTVEHGRLYRYAIRQIYQNVGSERIISDPITVGFDHMYLSDGERQLRIAFNPKVSSIKNTILETKMDTIGGQYPFFFRNNQVKYKEFPISGLISYQMDDNELFMAREIEQATINLTHDNFVAERKFKLAVLDWLTNGKPKLFRSPAEGNYIVRLINTSLSPDDKLGRMLHTFSSTAYETAAADLSTIISLGLSGFKYIKDVQYPTNYVNFNIIPDSPTIIEGEEIRDIVWITQYPGVGAEAGVLMLDSQPYYNTMGVFQTAPNDVYKKIEFNSFIKQNGDSISYKIKSGKTIQPTTSAQTHVLFSVVPGATLLDQTTPWTLQAWKDSLNKTITIHQMIVAPNSFSSEGSVIVNGVTCLTTHQTLHWQGDALKDVASPNNAILYFYATISELEITQFTLGVSLLGQGVLA